MRVTNRYGRNIITSMEAFLYKTVVAHGSLGALCLLFGIIALVAPKKKGLHGKAGKICAVSLILAVLAISPNIASQKNFFMVGLGMLAVFAAVQGWRALLRFKKRLPTQAALLDRTMAALLALSSLSSIGIGARAYANTKNVMGLVMVGIGVFGFMLIKNEVTRWRTPPKTSEWLTVHAKLMCGAFSGAVTAFVAVNLSGKVGAYEWAVWVVPIVSINVYASKKLKSMGL